MDNGRYKDNGNRPVSSRERGVGTDRQTDTLIVFTNPTMGTKSMYCRRAYGQDRQTDTTHLRQVGNSGYITAMKELDVYCIKILQPG